MQKLVITLTGDEVLMIKGRMKRIRDIGNSEPYALQEVKKLMEDIEQIIFG